jgi:hypothetical protein
MLTESVPLAERRKDPSDADNFNIHMASVGLTLASYFTTAYFSINAPNSDVMEDIDSVKWHKRLAYVHMSAMVIGPILGLKAMECGRFLGSHAAKV